MYRTIDTKIWDDPKVRPLATQAKLLFVYLITNRHTHVSGIYYLPLPTMQHELGVTGRAIESAFDVLAGCELAYFDPKNDIVFVKNMLRYQAHGPKAVRAVHNQLGTLHASSLIHRFISAYPEFKADARVGNGYLPDTLTIPYRDKEQEQEQPVRRCSSC